MIVSKRPLVLAALAWIASPIQAANLLPGGDFESDTAGWALAINNPAAEGAATVSFSAADAAHSGTKGAKVHVSTAQGSSNNWYIQLSVPVSGIELRPNRTYVLSYWAKSSASRTYYGAAQVKLNETSYQNLSMSTGWTKGTAQASIGDTVPTSFAIQFSLGTDTGTFYFDDFVFEDMGPSKAPSAIAFQAKPAWETGVYRNLFAEFGYAEDKVEAKVNGAFEQIFFGDSATQRLFRIVPDDTTMGFIDATDYVLTEGQSYGMMIAVQLDRKDIFDKLWKFAKTHMQRKSGDQQGYFAWKVANKAPFTPADVNPAPDGEEYFVTALYLADKRWTSMEGIAAYQNYKQQADSILHYMLKSRYSLGPLVDPTRKQIVFSPAGSNPFSDPSYHLPAFYRLWGAFAGHNNALWNAMADTSAAFFARCLKKSPYAINPNYATFDGDPAVYANAQVTDSGANAQRTYRYDTVYAADAHRTPMNIGMYWNWFQADTNAWWQTDRFLGFLREQGGATLKYNQVYNLAGQPCAPAAWGPAESQVGSNAAAVLASKEPANWAFVKAAFEQATPSGQYRYYNGMVYMLGLLNAAGKFKAWGSPGLVGGVAVRPGVGSTARFSIRLTGQNLKVSGVAGPVRLLDASGREAARTTANGSASFALPHSGLWVVDAGTAGRRTVVLP